MSCAARTTSVGHFEPNRDRYKLLAKAASCSHTLQAAAVAAVHRTRCGEPTNKLPTQPLIVTTKVGSIHQNKKPPADTAAVAGENVRMREVHNGITIADCSQEQHTAQPRIEQRACPFNSTVQVVIAAVPKFPSAVKRVS